MDLPLLETDVAVDNLDVESVVRVDFVQAFTGIPHSGCRLFRSASQLGLLSRDFSHKTNRLICAGFEEDDPT